MGCFSVEQRTKDGFFNATALLKQWNEITGSICTIAEYIEAYIPNSIRSNTVKVFNKEIYLPLSLEPQLRLYAANFDFDLYDRLEADIIVREITFSCTETEEDVVSIHQQQTYLMLDEACGAVKIGKSSDPRFREHTLGAQIPCVKLLAVCPKDIERELHDKYKIKRMRGEWFNLSHKDIRQIIKNYGFTRIK